MKLTQIITELKVVNLPASTHPRNTLVMRAAKDGMVDETNGIAVRKMRQKVSVTKRNNQKIWTLKTKPKLYKMVTSVEIE